MSSFLRIRSQTLIPVRIAEDKPELLNFDPANHALNGLPQCAFCKFKYGAWIGLKAHIEKGHCPVLYPESSTQGAAIGPETDNNTNPKAPEAITANEPPPIAQKLVLDAAQQLGWKSLLDTAIVSSLKQHCSVCKRWIADPTALKRHCEHDDGSGERLWQPNTGAGDEHERDLETAETNGSGDRERTEQATQSGPTRTKGRPTASCGREPELGGDAPGKSVAAAGGRPEPSAPGHILHLSPPATRPRNYIAAAFQSRAGMATKTEERGECPPDEDRRAGPPAEGGRGKSPTDGMTNLSAIVSHVS